MITIPTDPRQYYIDKYDEPHHHITALLKASVTTLDIRPRLLYPLADAGVKTVDDLLHLHSSGLRKVRNIGVSGASEIEHILRRYNLISINRPQKE